RVAPDDPATASRAAGVLARNQRAPEAVALAEAWARAHPSDYRRHMLLAEANAMSQAIEPALAHAARAVEAAPDSLGPRIGLGRLYQGEKRYGEAEQVWAETAKRFPQVGGVGLDLAFCREQQGNVDGAVSAARDVLRQHPDDPGALNFLGYLYAD